MNQTFQGVDLSRKKWDVKDAKSEQKLDVHYLFCLFTCQDLQVPWQVFKGPQKNCKWFTKENAKTYAKNALL